MRKRIAVLLAVAMMASVTAGCSGAEAKAPSAGTETSGGQTGENASQEAGESGENPIRIGVAAPITGNSAEYGKGFQVATQMAAEVVNAAGGVKGRPIEMVVKDSKGDAKESADVARIFCEEEDIVAVIGDFSSSSCMASAPIYQEKGLVQISPSASHPDFAKMGDYMFGVVGRQDDEGPFMAKYMAKKYIGAESVGVIFMNNDWGVVTSENFKQACEESGVAVTATESFIEGEKDFNAVISKVRQTDPDALCLITQYNEAAIISKQVKQAGWDVQIMGAGAMYSDQLIQLGGADVEGLIAESPFIIEESDPKAMEFAEEFEKRAGFKPNIQAASAYDTALLVADAIGRAEEVSRSAVRDALAATDNFMGITGPITFTEDGDVHRKYRVMAIQDGKWVELTGYDYYDE
ncbi:ABC transporter substrate-binding protein [Enterocloster lavalensis]|uniref:ABC transporter substrate-binding protein n=1 Tax=Enterocloster lavalensis TaxID=460384 RepID=UPI002A823555|nr:ABC transporter substrate-binding protein [Enterocloster lavalensis]